MTIPFRGPRARLALNTRSQMAQATFHNSSLLRKLCYWCSCENFRSAVSVIILPMRVSKRHCTFGGSNSVDHFEPTTVEASFVMCRRTHCVFSTRSSDWQLRVRILQAFSFRGPASKSCWDGLRGMLFFYSPDTPDSIKGSIFQSSVICGILHIDPTFLFSQPS